MMKLRVTWLAALPLAMAMASFANAGFRCGGCSDPCRPVRSHHHGCGLLGCGLHGGGAARPSLACGNSGAGVGYAGASYGASNYAGYSLVQPAPASCGAVAADGSYGMSYAPSIATTQIVGQSSVTACAPAPSVAYSQAPTISVGPQVVCEPVTGYRTVMESTFVTETQYVTAMETKQETRQRVKKVSKSVPVTYEDYRTKNITVPTTETKTIEYSVLVPETSTKTVDVNVSVPVWNEVSENYTVKVPVVSEVQETYNVSVPRLRDESYTYTVYAPQTETVTKIQTVTNAVPVVKTRTVQRTVPSYSTQTVTKDYGHWETVVEEVAGSSYGVSATGCAATTPSVCNAATQVVSNQAPASVGCGAGSAAIVSGGGCGNGLFAHRSHVCRKSGCGQSSCASGSCKTASCSRSATGSCGCGAAAGASCSSTGCGSNAIVGGNVSYAVANVGGCSTGCSTAAAPVTTTATRRVWVPSVVTEEVSVVTNQVHNEELAYTVYEQQSTQVPYECAYVVYRPEQRTGTRKVVELVSEARTRARKVVTYTDEQRTRTRRELSYKTETKQETYPVVTYRTEKKTKEISFTVQVPQQIVEPFQATRYETVTEDVVEDYTVSVQVPTTKEVQVQVCKMVPKLVPYTFNPCSLNNGVVATTGAAGSSAGCGCGSSAVVSGAAPASNGCGCGVSPAPASACGCR